MLFEITSKKWINIYNNMRTNSFLLFPVPSSILLNQWFHQHVLTQRMYSSTTDISIIQNVHLAWFLCMLNPTFEAYPKSSTSSTQLRNGCNSDMCVVVYIYRYHFWLNSRLLSVLTEHYEFSVSHLAHYLLCGKFIRVC